MAEALIRHDEMLDVNVRDSRVCTARELALRTPSNPVVRLLLRRKDNDVNIRMRNEDTALHILCLQSRIQMVQLLL